MALENPAKTKFILLYLVADKPAEKRKLFISLVLVSVN